MSTDLISRSALLRELNPKEWDLAYIETAAVVGMIRTAPAVDAEPVVRCGDCTRWYRHTEVDLERGDCTRYNVTKHESGYCDRGERGTDV